MMIEELIQIVKLPWKKEKLLSSSLFIIQFKRHLNKQTYDRNNNVH